MKNCLIILFTLTLISCSSNNDSTEGNKKLIGKWKLIEQYSDPGDGSGTFQPISSERIIEFFSNDTVEVNGELCFMASNVSDKESGTYNLITDSGADTQYDGEIIPNICSSRSAKVYFDLPVSGNLILWYLCIEGCGQKFKKI